MEGVQSVSTIEINKALDDIAHGVPPDGEKDEIEQPWYLVLLLEQKIIGEYTLIPYP